VIAVVEQEKIQQLAGEVAGMIPGIFLVGVHVLQMVVLSMSLNL
jgi:hypothetical protein